MTASLCIGGMGIVTALAHIPEWAARPVAPELIGLARAMALSRPALAACIEQAKDAAGRTTALLLCVPRRDTPPLSPTEEASAQQSKLVAAVASELETRHRVPVRALLSFDAGPAAGIMALRRAADFLASGVADQCIVGGVDCAGERAIVECLDRAPHVPVPGEAAAFLCLRRTAGGAAAAVIEGPSCAHERARGPVVGAGMADAMTAALAAWGGDPGAVAFVAADLGNLSEGARRTALVTLRLLWPTHVLPEVLHSVDQLGDVAAASAPLLVGLAAQRLLTAPKGSAVLILCSGPATLRGAAIVTRPLVEEP